MEKEGRRDKKRNLFRVLAGFLRESLSGRKEGDMTDDATALEKYKAIIDRISQPPPGVVPDSRSDLEEADALWRAMGHEARIDASAYAKKASGPREEGENKGEAD